VARVSIGCIESTVFLLRIGEDQDPGQLLASCYVVSLSLTGKLTLIVLDNVFISLYSGLIRRRPKQSNHNHIKLFWGNAGQKFEMQQIFQWLGMRRVNERLTLKAYRIQEHRIPVSHIAIAEKRLSTYTYVYYYYVHTY
jgi:hypothetical protein